MSNLMIRARQMSLALLVTAVVDHGALTLECSGSTPNSSGLVRLGRDLMRRSQGTPHVRRPVVAAAARSGRIPFERAESAVDAIP